MKLTLFFLVLMLLIVLGCIDGKRGKLKKTTWTTKEALRQQWTDYTVYYKSDTALLYQIKNKKKVILPDDWGKVTSAEMMGQSTIFEHTVLREILGNNDELIGYLEFRIDDQASVVIVDEKTIRLYYQRVVIQGP